MEPKAPCRECEKRSIGCHGTCSEYLEFKKNIDEARERKRSHMVNTYYGGVNWFKKKITKGDYRFNP